MGGNIYILLIIQKFKINFLDISTQRVDISKKHRIAKTYRFYSAQFFGYINPKGPTQKIARSKNGTFLRCGVSCMCPPFGRAHPKN